ncbi:unnamed protein product [Microthlaspi erraticum]|uniref:Uncharacterized protein n=1 Tax=Microthlaspi erraticum TaxID=1685480 RepID=A0A6D2L6V7_9BRAS|nr:unnamed protein product [Microthlaspi erraticum]
MTSQPLSKRMLLSPVKSTSRWRRPAEEACSEETNPKKVKDVKEKKPVAARLRRKNRFYSSYLRRDDQGRLLR